MSLRLLPPLAAFLFLASALLGPISAAQAGTTPVYIALGDSLAFGVGADNPATQGYVGLTAASLRQTDTYKTTGLDLDNLSVPGALSADLLTPNGQVDQAVAEIESQQGAALISIDIGANDLLQLADPNLPCLDEPSSKECQTALGEMLNTLQANLRTILQRLRAAAPGTPIYLIDVYNPYSGTKDPREVVASVGVQQVDGVIAAAAADTALNVTFVSVRDLFEGRAGQWIASDGIHPNNDGHRVMAEALLAAIENRSVVLPSDLAVPPSSTGVPDASADSDGVDALVPEVGIPVAFVAGLMLAAAYFVVSGRR